MRVLLAFGRALVASKPCRARLLRTAPRAITHMSSSERIRRTGAAPTCRLAVRRRQCDERLTDGARLQMTRASCRCSVCCRGPRTSCPSRRCGRESCGLKRQWERLRVAQGSVHVAGCGALDATTGSAGGCDTVYEHRPSGALLLRRRWVRERTSRSSVRPLERGVVLFSNIGFLRQWR